MILGKLSSLLCSAVHLVKPSLVATHDASGRENASLGSWQNADCDALESRTPNASSHSPHVIACHKQHAFTPTVPLLAEPVGICGTAVAAESPAAAVCWLAAAVGFHAAAVHQLAAAARPPAAAVSWLGAGAGLPAAVGPAKLPMQHCWGMRGLRGCPAAAATQAATTGHITGSNHTGVNSDAC